MRTVIYDAEGYEPLTVIEVPQHFMREIERGERQPVLRFPVQHPLSMAPVRERIEFSRFKTVTLRFEPIYGHLREVMLWLCTTQDAETALLLRSTFLPGQRGEVNRQLEQAFLSGLFAAVS